MHVCCVEGCNGWIKAHGLCNKHYLRAKRNGSLESLFTHAPMEERFWRRVEKRASDECWEWLGSKRPNGYGMVHTGGRGGKYISTHRYSCELHYGPPPFQGAHTLHSCDNPSCVNPAHLRWGTASENILEAFAKNRKVAPRIIGENHPRAVLTEDQVKFIKAHPEISTASLARIMGNKLGAVRAVRQGRTWKHL